MAATARRVVIPTPGGDAWLDLDAADGPRLLVIGHGAGGTVEAPDLLAVRDCCLQAGVSVARVTQPYRVAGRKAPPTAAALDAAWAAVISALGRREATRKLLFSFGGRSSGARVACRTSTQGLMPPPDSVVALAFPVHPPGKPERSRLDELDSVTVPVLVVQGASDPFGLPPAAPGRMVLEVPGDHSLRRSAALVGQLVADWLTALDSP